MLEQDINTNENGGVINVSIGNDNVQFSIQVPIGNMKTEYLEIELGSKVYNIEYRYGTLDEVKRDSLVRKKAKYYYQKYAEPRN